MGQDLVTNEEAIRRATRNSLLRAEELGLTSIAFPALEIFASVLRDDLS
jgi:O-acetyl-ADP-ribose deacetylase (regulator of RNase III)